MILREYQLDAIARLREAIARGSRRLILQASTGAGKTVMAAEVMRSAVAKGKRVLFLAHARELVNQCSDKLDRFDVPHGVIMAGRGYHRSAPVQVASKDTLLSRAVRLKRIALPPADLVIADECHRSLSRYWRHLLDQYPTAVVLGLTATPARGDGRGLGDLYQAMVQAAPSSGLIGQGFLVPTRVFAPYQPDLKGVKRSGHDYSQPDLEKRMDRAELIGDIVGHWRDLAGGRRTVVFASGVAHSMHIRDEFTRAGVTAEHLDAKTPADERDGILRRLASGATTVVTNCGVLTEGWDCPAVSCCVLARPTRSFVLYRQMAGRIQRPLEGKADALLIDHAGAFYLHGFPDDDIEWTLEPSRKVQDAVKERIREGKMKEPIACPSCHAIYSGLPACPNCGRRRQRLPKERKGGKGKLVEVGRDGPRQLSHEDKQRQWNRALGIAASKGGKCRMAGAIYKQYVGEWPAGELRNLPRGCQWEQYVSEVLPQYNRRAVA